MSRSAPAPRRPGTASGAASSAQRVLPLCLVVVTTGALLGGAGLAVRERLDQTSVPVSVGRPVTFADLRVTVTDFQRRADAVAGVNAEALPLSGPAMPMSMGQKGTGQSPHDMSAMPGMAGMLHPGQERVDVRLEVANDGRRQAELDAGGFWLTSRGRPVQLLQPSTSEIQGDLAPGFRVGGTVTFVIPEGTAPLVLHYADDPAGVLLDAGGGGQDHHAPGAPEHAHR